MTLEEARSYLAEFLMVSQATEHPFLIASFSHEDRRYEIMEAGLDKFDAIMLIREIIKIYKLARTSEDMEILLEVLRGDTRDKSKMN